MFSAKAPQRITTVAKRWPSTGAQVERSSAASPTLGAKLGPIVWQFDPRTKLDRDDFAAFLDCCRRDIDGPRAAPRARRARSRASSTRDYIALARQHGMATVFTDSAEHPSFADVTADFVYARLMRSRSDVATGYPRAELDAGRERAREWAAGDEPADLPRIARHAPPRPAPRDVFVYFISSAKERNPGRGDGVA